MELFILEGLWLVYVRHLNGYVPIDNIDPKRLKYQENPQLVDPQEAINYLMQLNSTFSKRRIYKQIMLIRQLMKNDFYSEILNED